MIRNITDRFVFGACHGVRLRSATLSVRALKLSCVLASMFVIACGSSKSTATNASLCAAGNSSVIHAPANEACPQGFTLAREFFVERDGSKRAACISKTRGDGSIDCLMPGEGVHVTIEIESAGKENGEI
jgi:hypothetical protein